MRDLLRRPDYLLPVSSTGTWGLRARTPDRGRGCCGTTRETPVSGLPWGDGGPDPSRRRERGPPDVRPVPRQGHDVVPVDEDRRPPSGDGSV